MADATCNGACTLPASTIDFPTQAVTLASAPWTNSAPLTGSTPPVDVRCDSAPSWPHVRLVPERLERLLKKDPFFVWIVD
ncbi:MULTISPECIES: hypothetical protein [unclassified Streptomyces]|uniref:hypothetical protein n=1 Tax=unclassified Streptomyces TaxID=2593676 RepID=UPI000DD72252|nr:MULTISPECIES: hypothetical protein [unclassified Streptomyces]QZZ24895.1 hypothetical protein A7X85_05160 [Streptomyces sp. ST1015]